MDQHLSLFLQSVSDIGACRLERRGTSCACYTRSTTSGM